MLGNVGRVLRQLQNSRKVFNPWSLKEAKKFLATSGARAGSLEPEPTSVRYKVTRGPYATVTNSHLRFFEDLLGKDRLLTDPDECESYNVDWVKMVRGGWKLVGV